MTAGKKTNMPTRKSGEGYERHSLGTIEKINRIEKKVARLEIDLANQRILTTVGLLSKGVDEWPLVCHEHKTSGLCWIFREDGNYWSGKEWLNSYDARHRPEFAKTYTYKDGCSLIRKRFWRGFSSGPIDNRRWIRPPSLVLVPCDD